MSNKLIQWPKAKYWDHPYNPVLGCQKISEGCLNCYAQRMIEKLSMNGGNFEPVRMGDVKVPRSGIVFAGNMTDLFGEWNDFGHILIWLTKLSLGEKAIPLVLTKRAARLRMFSEYAAGNIYEHMTKFWFGVTAENQPRADERIPELLQCREVMHRWLSLEPLLGPVNFRKDDFSDNGHGRGWLGKSLNGLNGVEWVVVGHESGQNRRPGNIDDVRSVVKQCVTAGVPVFVKQLDLGGKDVEKDINKFPEDLRIRQTPWITINFRIEL